MQKSQTRKNNKNTNKMVKRNNNNNKVYYNSTRNQVDLDRRIKQAIQLTKAPRSNLIQTPLYKYIAGLIDFDEVAPSTLTPLTPGKKHLKTVRATQTITVNASGNLIIALTPAFVTRCDAASTYYYMYHDNSAPYDPNDATGATGTPTKNNIITSSLALDLTQISKIRTGSLHMRFRLSGVSNLNKQGTIHLLETVATDGNSTGPLKSTFNIPYAPLCEVYKSIEIANMDLTSHIQYNYFPLANTDILSDYNSVANVISSLATSNPYKQFALIVSGAAVGTSIKIDLECTAECEVERNYINVFPVNYSNCFMDSNPTLQYLNQHHDLRIQTKQKSNNYIVPTVLKTVTNQQKEMVLSDLNDSLFNISSISQSRANSGISRIIK